MGLSPIKAYWTIIPDAKTYDEGTVLLVGGIVKTIIDLLVTTLPIPLILRMKVARRQRYGLAILLALGYVVTAAGAVRSYYTWKIFHNPLWDQSWFQYPCVLAGAIENELAVVCFIRLYIH
jgi:hypothetical protein